MEGKALRVLGHLHRGGQYQLTLELPDGTRTLIPACWTDLEEVSPPASDAESPAKTSPQLGSVHDLLQARKVVDALLRKLEDRQPPANDHSQEERHDGTPNGVLARDGDDPLQARAVGESEQRGTSRADRTVGAVDREDRMSVPEVERRDAGERS